MRNPYPDPDPDPDPPPRPPPPAAHHAPLINLIGPPQGPAAKPPTALEDERGSKSALMGLKVVSEIFLSSLVLLCTVFSKLSLVGLTDDLTEITRLVNNWFGLRSFNRGQGCGPLLAAAAHTTHSQLHHFPPMHAVRLFGKIRQVLPISNSDGSCCGG